MSQKTQPRKEREEPFPFDQKDEWFWVGAIYFSLAWLMFIAVCIQIRGSVPH